MNKILIYGAYGYTGRLIIDQFLSQGIKPLIAGRNKEKTMALGDEKGLEAEGFDLAETDKLNAWLGKGAVVIHCAGPFSHTAKQMLDACIETKTHYLDITGEYEVLDLAQSFDNKAKEAGIMVMPGAGFDVVPSDCLAAHLYAQMPDATHLELAFVNKGSRLSRGTAKTMIEGIGKKQAYRKDGKYAYNKSGHEVKEIDFGEFKQISMAIPWGDISTAYFSTGIPNIQVYLGSDKNQIGQARKAASLGFLLKLGFVQNFLKKQIDKKPAGPSDEKRAGAKTYMWGKVSNGDKEIEARIVAPDGYTLTALTTVSIANKVTADQFTAGYQTPSTAYGKDLILEVDGCEWG